MSVSALAQTLKGSEIIKIGGEINELKKKGEKISEKKEQEILMTY